MESRRKKLIDDTISGRHEITGDTQMNVPKTASQSFPVTRQARIDDPMRPLYDRGDRKAIAGVRPRTRAQQCHLRTSTSQRRRVCKRPAIESIKRHDGCARSGQSLVAISSDRPMCVASMTPRLLPWYRCKDCFLAANAHSHARGLSTR